MTRRKLWDIDHPPVLLIVGLSTDLQALATSLSETTEFRIERAETPAAALERVADRPAVDCCWVAPESATEEWFDFVASLDGTDDELSVVFAPSSSDTADAARATALGAGEYVDPDATAEQRRERATTAVERAIDRRHDAVKRSMFEAFVDELGPNVFVKDEQARHLVHPSTVTTDEEETLFGLTDLEAFGTNDDTLRDAYRDDLSVVRDGVRIEGKVERYPDFQQGWQWTTKVPWVDDGETRGVVGLTMEVSEWKNRERELLQQLGYFQRIPKYLTHDLRNPLAIAQGYVQLARADEPGALDTVEESLDRMSEKLTEFHGLIDGPTTNEQARTPVRFVRIVENVWGHVSLPGTDIEIDADPDARLLADEAQLRPLLQNVFRNAIDHAGPRVTVHVELTEDGFAIGDDGPGIDDLSGTDVFEAGTTTAAEGAGLGLAIVREVAHLHGWDVDVGRSDLGGAQLTVSNCLVGRPLDAECLEESIAIESSIDVGDVDHPGSTTIDGDVATISGAGSNVWGNVNEFQFAYAPVDSDVRIEAKIAEMDVASDFSKAGLMLRSNTDEGAAYGAIGRMADRFPEILYRTEPGERGYSIQAEGIDDATNWLAIERVGDSLSLAVSADGDDWTPLDRQTVELGEAPVAGLFVCSVADGEPIEARFEDVAIDRLA